MNFYRNISLFVCLTLAITVLSFSHASAEITDYEEGLKKINELDEGMQQCAETLARIERLICYDELAQKMGYTLPEKAEREEDILETFGFWEVTKRRTAAGEYITYLKNDTVEDVISQSGIRRKPTLVIKCKHGHTDVYLDWKSRLLPQYTGGTLKQPLMYQMDASEQINSNWELSTDRQAIFAPDPIEFVKALKKHDRLIFYITPQHDIAQTLVHDITGLNSALEVLVRECYN